MKKINHRINPNLIHVNANGQDTIPFFDKTWVKIGKEWFEILKPAKDLYFPVTNKEYTIRKLLSKIDEIKN